MISLPTQIDYLKVASVKCSTKLNLCCGYRPTHYERVQSANEIGQLGHLGRGVFSRRKLSLVSRGLQNR